MNFWFKRLTCVIIASAGNLLAEEKSSSVLEPAKAIIVLDASGSMWGKVQGRPKIEIAREVIRDFVSDLPEQVELGLVVYGHRKKGDCNDIELLIEPKQVSKNEFVKAVYAIQPKGMTPLTAAVEYAAEVLKSTEQKASVILVTDGEETCDRDPCEAAQKLEAEGLDFTAHVIAFDLSDKDSLSVKCLATTTGGEFLKANDAKSLKNALDSAMKATVELPSASLKAPSKAATSSEIEVTWSSDQKLEAFLTIVPAKSEATQIGAKTPVGLENKVKMLTPDQPGTHEVRLIDTESKEILATAYVELYLNDIKLEAPKEALIGAEVPIKWSGSSHLYDYIHIAPKNAPDDVEKQNWRYAQDGKELKLLAPLKSGDYEVRYVSAVAKEVFARADIKIIDADIIIDAPKSAVSGSQVKIDFKGPNNKNDYITIVPKDFPDEKYAKYQYTRDDTTVRVEAPLTVGAAEIRYISGQGNKVLARQDIELTPFEITFDAPKSAVSGSIVKIDFKGPNNKDDYITIVPKDFPDEKYAKYQYTRDDTTVRVEAPLTVGAAEIRYISGQENKVLARQDIELTPFEITFDAPKSAVSGSTVKIDFKGPNNKDDYITIVPKDFPDEKYAKYQYTRDDTSVRVEAPLTVGAAEIRYISGQENKVLARQDIELTPFEITFDAPKSAVSGSTVKIDFKGPNNKDDYITIVPKDFPDEKYAKYQYTRDDTSVRVEAPLTVGAAEIRYISGQGNKVLARQDLELTAFEVTLEVPEKAKAGERFEVKWDGPNNNSDYITIVPKGTPDDQSKNYIYTRDDKSGKLQALDTVGEAEVRYVSGQERRVEARKSIIIE